MFISKKKKQDTAFYVWNLCTEHKRYKMVVCLTNFMCRVNVCLNTLRKWNLVREKKTNGLHKWCLVAGNGDCCFVHKINSKKNWSIHCQNISTHKFLSGTNDKCATKRFIVFLCGWYLLGLYLAKNNLNKQVIRT